jgi:hypothetical protein
MSVSFWCYGTVSKYNYSYTTKNATDLQVVDFTGLMQIANKLYQAF